MIKRTLILLTAIIIVYGIAGKCDARQGYFDVCLKMEKRQLCLDMQAIKLSWGNR